MPGISNRLTRSCSVALLIGLLVGCLTGCKIEGHRKGQITFMGQTLTWDDEAVTDKDGNAQAYRAGFDDESNIATMIAGRLLGPPEPDAKEADEADDEGDDDGG